jgi:membrane fusion protein (multidrug efflux system)
MRLPDRTATALFLAAALHAGCGATSAPPEPPVEVHVVTIAPERIATTVEVPARASALRTAEVRARADGVVVRRAFEDGAEVEAGQVLYELDPARLRAADRAARASLAAAAATSTWTSM